VLDLLRTCLDETKRSDDRKLGYSGFADRTDSERWSAPKTQASALLRQLAASLLVTLDQALLRDSFVVPDTALAAVPVSLRAPAKPRHSGGGRDRK
jgi:hypothetical protein